MLSMIPGSCIPFNTDRNMNGRPSKSAYTSSVDARNGNKGTWATTSAISDVNLSTRNLNVT